MAPDDIAPAPTFTPPPKALAEVELALLGIGGDLVSMHVDEPAGQAAAERRQLIVTDEEGAPVAVLHVESAAEKDGSLTLTGRVRRATAEADGDAARGPHSALRVPPGQLALDRPVAVVTRDPVDAPTLAVAVEAGGDVLIVVLSGPRSAPGPPYPDVAAAALTVRDQLRDDGRQADVVVVPAPEHGDERDERLADQIAAAYGATRARPVRQPDEAALRAWLDGRGKAPLSDWPRASLAAWRRWRPLPNERGLVVLFTGLSGSGKSTIARAAADRLAELGSRTVTLLDGDVVRRNLSAGLGFSRADRDRNVERIGFVAAEIARHGGIALCAPIAPFAATRARVRKMAEANGDFLLVHVATPLAECERRDRKGLYARARAGEIPDFTGVSSPYETPEDADLTVDTSKLTVAEARDLVIDLLVRAGRI